MLMSSYDLRLASKQEYGDFFAPSWLAGTADRTKGLLKTVQKYDIYSVNVPSTCDKLMRLVTTPRTRTALKSSRDIGMSEEDENVGPTKKMPFRIASTICYGTLRIYRLQVDRLLNQSRDLCARSNCELKFAIMEAQKRKSSSSNVSCVPAKKRRYVKTTTHKVQKTTTTNFSQMLDEWEGLLKWPAIFDEPQIENQSSASLFTQKRVQMREITIRETNLDLVVSRNDPLFDDFFEFEDDLGFGDITHTTELKGHFQELFAQSNAQRQRQSLKRKISTDHHNNNNKLQRICSVGDVYTPDTSIELSRCASLSINSMNVSPLISDHIIPQNREHASNTLIEGSNVNEIGAWVNAAASTFQATPEPERCFDFGHMDLPEISNIDESPPVIMDLQHTTPQLSPQKKNNKLSFDQRMQLELNIADTNINGIETLFDAAASTFYPTLDFGHMDMPKNVQTNIIDVLPPDIMDFQQATLHPPPQKKSKLKPSIDNRIEFTSTAVMAQVQNRANLKIAIKKPMQLKKSRPKAHELFSNLSRNHILHYDLKQKPKISPDIVEREYINLIREIFSDQSQANINDLATEIHPKWQQQVDVYNIRKKRKRKLSATEKFNATMNNLLLELEENNNSGVATKLTTLPAENNVIAGDDVCANGPQCVSENGNGDEKWRPYGVMMQLLDIWRFASSDSDGDLIDAKRFCLSADNRLHCAMAFSSLLVLAAHKCIIINKSANSVEMETIELGAKSDRLVCDVARRDHKA